MFSPTSMFATQREAFSFDIAERSKPAFKAMGSLLVGLGKKLEDTGLLDKFGVAFTKIGTSLDNIKPGLIKIFSASMEGLANAFDRIATIAPAFFEGFLANFDSGLLSEFFSGDLDKDTIEGNKLASE